MNEYISTIDLFMQKSNNEIIGVGVVAFENIRLFN